jgi:hypothetical protein
MATRDTDRYTSRRLVVPARYVFEESAAAERVPAVGVN